MNDIKVTSTVANSFAIHFYLRLAEKATDIPLPFSTRLSTTTMIKTFLLSQDQSLGGLDYSGPFHGLGTKTERK